MVNYNLTLGWSSDWDSNPPELIPAMRMLFRTRDDRVILDSTMSWDDMAFVIDRLADYLARTMGEGKELAGQLNVSVCAHLGKRIQGAQGNISKILEMAEFYGIGVDSEEPKK